MKPRISMRESLVDPDLFGLIMAGPSWRAWRILLVAAAGEQLYPDERELFKKLTNRDREPGHRCREIVFAAGRRGGKTTALAVFDCWISALNDHRGDLMPGEIGVSLLISRDQRAATVLLDRIEGILRASPILNQLIVSGSADTIELTNGISIEVRPCNRVSVRGATFISVLADELAFWFTSSEQANPDSEVLAGARPGLLTTQGPCVMASSVYAKKGELYEMYRYYFGADRPDILVAYGASRDFNPTLSEEDVNRELERDPVRNRAEYLSEWRDDITGFISRDVVEACVSDFIELPYRSGLTYRIFLDQASGVEGGDSFAVAVSYRERDHITIVALRECCPPFSPSEVINTVLLPLCRAYKVSRVTGDAYGGEFPRELCRKAGITFELATKHKSELYRDPFLPLLLSKKISLPRNDRAISQICNLERSLQRSGREQISHPVHGRDDLSNAIAGAADLAHGASNLRYDVFDPNFRDEDLPPLPPAQPEPVRCDGNWWRSMPRQQPTFSADERLRGLYQSLDGAFKSGSFR